MYVLSMYNEMVDYEEEQLLKQPPAGGSSLDTTTATKQQQQVINKAADSMMLRKNQPQHQNNEETLVLVTKHGDIRILLRPDLSRGSVDYIHRLMDSGCQRCNLYRAEKPGILQGVMANQQGVATNDVKGDCPPEAQNIPVGDCPSWDANCACHGPLMTQGSVAWAAGSAGGPDFFIDNYKEPATHWGTQHTNFGFIQDERSLELVNDILDMPKTNRNGMHILDDVVSFQMRLE